jgi:hypothetical protein
MLGTAQAAVDPLGHEREERGEKERGERRKKDLAPVQVSHQSFQPVCCDWWTCGVRRLGHQSRRSRGRD